MMINWRNIFYGIIIALAVGTVTYIVTTNSRFNASEDLGTGGGVSVCSDDKPFSEKYTGKVTDGFTAGNQKIDSVTIPNYTQLHQVDFVAYVSPFLEQFLSGKTLLDQSDYLQIQSIVNSKYSEWSAQERIQIAFRDRVINPPIVTAADTVNGFNYHPNDPLKKYLGLSNPLKKTTKDYAFEIKPTGVNWDRLAAGGYLDSIDMAGTFDFAVGKGGLAEFKCLQLFGNFSGAGTIRNAGLSAVMAPKKATYVIKFVLGYNADSSRGYGRTFPW